MSKESAIQLAVGPNPQPSEARSSPVTGVIPENAKEAANPAVENKGVVPQSLQSTQLSRLAKQEQKLRMDQEAFKKQQEELKAKETKYQEILMKAESFEAARKQDPIKALRDLGFTEKEIIDYLTLEEAPKPTTEEVVQAEMKKFKDEQAKKEADAKAANDQVLVSKFKTQITSVVASDSDKYEACTLEGPIAEQLIFDIAVEEAKAGQIPDPKSIADDVEEYFVNVYKERSKLKKLTPKQEAVLETKEPIRTRVVHPPLDAPKPKATTLTNRQTATAAAVAKPAAKTETREEKRARLEQLIRNGLTRH